MMVRFDLVGVEMYVCVCVSSIKNYTEDLV